MEPTTQDAIGLQLQRDTVMDLELDHGQERPILLRRLLGEGPCRQLGICPIPPDFLLSVVIPVYNEEQYIRAVVERVQAVPLPKEVIIINDCSTVTCFEHIKIGSGCAISWNTNILDTNAHELTVEGVAEFRKSIGLDSPPD